METAQPSYDVGASVWVAPHDVVAIRSLTESMSSDPYSHIREACRSDLRYLVDFDETMIGR